MRHTQTSFSGGEFSARMYGRFDYAKYHTALAKLRNFIPQPQGGAIRRPGSKYVTTTKNLPTTDTVRVVPFIPSSGDPFVLEFGQSYIRFMQAGSQVVTGTTSISAITRAASSFSVTNVFTSGGGPLHSVNYTVTAPAVPVGASITFNITGHPELSGNFTVVTNSGTVITVGLVTLSSFSGYTGSMSVYIDTFTVGSTASFSASDTVSVSSVLSSPANEFNYSLPMATVPDSTHFTVYPQSWNAATYISGGSATDITLTPAAYTVTSPYTGAADVSLLSFAQVNDVMYCFHPSYPVYKLSHFATTNWTMVNLMDPTTPASTYLLYDGPYLQENNTSTTMTPAASAVGSTTVTASAVTGINSGSGFLSTDVGRIIRINNQTTPSLTPNWGWGVITAVGSTTSATVYIMRACGSTSATTRWNLGAWSATTGYPAVGCLYQQRLVGASTTAEPQKIWMSYSADLQNFQATGQPYVAYNAGPPIVGPTDTVTDANAVVLQPAFSRTAQIRWMISMQSLMIGTSSIVYQLNGGTSQAVTPTNASISEASAFPVQSNVQPIRVGKALLFVQNPGRKLREMLYDLFTNTFAAKDMAQAAYHLTENGIREMTYADNPNCLLWMVKNDGTLAAMTYNLEEQVLGWSSHQMGGSYNGGAPFVESIASIPTSNYNQVYMVVWRTNPSGTVVRTIEVLQQDFDSLVDSQAQAWYLDAATQIVNTSPSTAVSGLTWLEGQTVQIYADGAMQADKTVSSGAITLDTAATTVLVGLNCEGSFVPLPVSRDDGGQVVFGDKVKISQVGFRFLDAAGYQFAKDESATFYPTTFQQGQTVPNTPPPLFTGDNGPLDASSQNVGGESHFQNAFAVKTLAALPLTILAYVADFTTGEG